MDRRETPYVLVNLWKRRVSRVVRDWPRNCGWGARDVLFPRAMCDVASLDSVGALDRLLCPLERFWWYGY